MDVLPAGEVQPSNPISVSKRECVGKTDTTTVTNDISKCPFAVMY